VTAAARVPYGLCQAAAGEPASEPEIIGFKSSPSRSIRVCNGLRHPSRQRIPCVTSLLVSQRLLASSPGRAAASESATGCCIRVGSGYRLRLFTSSPGRRRRGISELNTVAAWRRAARGGRGGVFPTREF
jgi:hypothetical protein